jgi:hypothetical protein
LRAARALQIAAGMIRSKTLLHSALLALLFTAACGKEDKKTAPKATEPPAAAASAKPAPPPPPPPAKPAAKVYKDETYNFTVEHARDPQRSEQQVPTALGPVTAYAYMFSAPSAPGAAMVMVTPSFIPQDKGLDLDTVLENSQQGSLTTMAGTLLESKKIELDGAVGRAFRFKATPQGHAAVGYAKIVVRGDTLYQAMVVSMESAKDFQAEGEAFVDSLHLLPAKP